MPVSPEIEGLLIAVIYYGLLTSLYKDNPIYTFVEPLVVGALLGNEVAVNLTRIQTSVLGPLAAGNLILIGTVVVGVLYFFILSPRLSAGYRLVCVLSLAATFGLEQSSSWTTAYLTNMMWATSVTDISSLLLVIGVVTTVIYFTFSRKMEAPLRHIRTVGKVFLFAFFGISVGTMWWRYTNKAIGLAMQAITPPGIYVPFLIALYIALDALGVINRITGRKPSITV